MGFILAWVATLASSAVVRAIVARVLVALGINFVSFVGVYALASQVDSWMSGQLGTVEADMLGVLNLCGFTQALSLIVSAWFARFALKGLTATGSLTKIFWDGTNSIVLNPP